MLKNEDAIDAFDLDGYEKKISEDKIIWRDVFCNINDAWILITRDVENKKYNVGDAYQLVAPECLRDIRLTRNFATNKVQNERS